MTYVEHNGLIYLVWTDCIPRWAQELCDSEGFRWACFGGFENAVEISLWGM